MEQVFQEKKKIERDGTLHWYHWMLVVSSLLLTLAAWQFAIRQVDEKISLQFNRDAEQLIDLVQERMGRYEDGLWSGVSAIQAAGGDISNNSWRNFAESLSIDTKYPGINGIGVIHYVSQERLPSYLADQQRDRPNYNIHPPHGAGEYWPITYIEPHGLNAAAVGLDIAHETNRYTAARKARDSGLAQVTGPIILVQDAEKTPGFLFYAPFYKGINHHTIDERRENFVGMVYAPFVFKKLMEGTLEKEKRRIGIRILDTSDTLYDEHVPAEPDYDPNPLFKRQVDTEFYGRTWTFDIWSTQSFRTAADSSQPTLILIGGIIIDTLLLALFVFLSRANRRAVSFADRMTQNYQRKSEELAELVDRLTVSNEDLEHFAYVASHDLKAPLRGIDNLAEWIDADLKDVMTEQNRQQMGLLRGRVRRLESLLEGLLQYSRIGHADEEIEFVDTKALVENFIDLLNPPGTTTITVASDMPSFFTARAPLQQTLHNLISNAIKHHDRDDGHIEISGRDLGSHVEFTVADDGPGIPEQFHDRVLQMFQTLKRRDEVEGSGIGLALVSKQVRTHGGALVLEDKVGQSGAIFRFTWRKTDMSEGAKHAA